MLLTLLSNFQAGLYYIINDIDTPNRMLYFSGFNFSYKDFSPGFPARLSVMLPTLLSNYQINLNHSIDDFDTLKWILYFSGFNFSCKDFSPRSASFPLPALEHQLYTSLGPAPLPLLPPTLLRLLQSSPARPSTTTMTLLLKYQIRLNGSIDDIDIPKRILFLSGFKPRCKDFSPGSASFLSSIIAHQFHISSPSDFIFSCKDFSPGFASLLSSIAANQFHTSSTRLSAILLTQLSNYLSGFNVNC